MNLLTKLDIGKQHILWCTSKSNLKQNYLNFPKRSLNERLHIAAPKPQSEVIVSRKASPPYFSQVVERRKYLWFTFLPILSANPLNKQTHLWLSYLIMTH